MDEPCEVVAGVGGRPAKGDECGVVAEASADVGEEVTPDVTQKRFGAALGPLGGSFGERIEVTALIARFDDTVGVEQEGFPGFEGEHVQRARRWAQGADSQRGRGCSLRVVTECSGLRSRGAGCPQLVILTMAASSGTSSNRAVTKRSSAPASSSGGVNSPW